MAFDSRPHFIEGAQYPLSAHAQQTPPIPCEYQIGDVVTFTNEFGVEFPGRLVTGFSPTIENGRFIYWDNSAWWFPADPSQLTHDATNDSEHWMPREAVMAFLARHDEACHAGNIGYYADIQTLAKKVRSSKVRSSKSWSQGEVFVYAKSEQCFVVMKQIAPSSCELMTLTHNGFHDVLTAYRFEEQELVNMLEDYLESNGSKTEAASDQSCG